jgi:O-antigen ligase
MPRLRKLMAAGVIGILAIIAVYLAGRIPEHYLLPILRILGLIQISFTAPSMQDYSTAERLAHWIAGINMFIAHPVTGVGIGAYGDGYAPYHITIFVNSLGHAHNYYINIAAETGLIGLTAFLLFLIATFVTSGRAYRAISTHLMAIKAQREKPRAGQTAIETQKTARLQTILTDDRALAIGLLAALVSVCIHNLVDDLYVHGMSTLFALLLIALIRLEGVTSNNT